MKVVTYQHKNVVIQLLQNGYYFVQDDVFTPKGSKKYYKWIITKMSHLDNKYNAKYPIWVFTRNYKDTFKELITKNNYEIYLDIPNKLILESNFYQFEDYVITEQPFLLNKKEKNYLKNIIIRKKENINCAQKLLTLGIIYLKTKIFVKIININQKMFIKQPYGI